MENKLLKEEMIAMRNDMRGYFGLGGTVAKQIGTKTATAVLENS